MEKKTKKVLLTLTAASSVVGTSAQGVFATEALNKDQMIQSQSDGKKDEEIANLKEQIEKKKTEMEAQKTEVDSSQKEYTESSQATQKQKEIYDQAKVEEIKAEKKANDKIIADLEKTVAEIETKQKELDTAKSDKESKEKELASKQEALKNSEEAVKKAQEELNEAMKNAENVTDEELTKAQEKVNEAKTKLDTAKAELVSAKEAYSLKEEELKKANEKLETLQLEQQELAKKVESLEIDFNNAQKAYDEAFKIYEGATDPAKKEEAQKELDTAKANLNTAQAELNNVVKTKEEADKAVESAQSELNNAQKDLDTAKAANNDAIKAVERIQRELETAQKDLETEKTNHADLIKEKEALKAIVVKKQEALDTAKKELENTQHLVNEAEAAVTDTTNLVAEKEKALAESSAKYQKGSLGFFEEMKADLAVKYLTEPKDEIDAILYAYTEIGAEGDATNLHNMKNTLDYMKQCNEIRLQLGLSELKVTHEMMVAAQLQVNWTAGVKNEGGSGSHSGLFNLGENLAYGPGTGYDYNPFEGWYDREKGVYEDACKTDPEIVGKDATWLKDNRQDLYQQIGHYLNIINKDYTMTGFAINNKGEINDGIIPVVFSQTFNFENNPSFNTSQQFTVDEYAEMFDKYYSSVINAADELYEAQEMLQQAVEYRDGLKNELTKKEGAVTQAEGALTKANNDVVAKQGEIEDSNKMIAEKEQVITDKKVELGQAQTIQEATQSEVDKAQGIVTTKEGLLSDAQGIASARQEDVNKANQNVQDKQAIVNEKQEVMNKIEEGAEQAEKDLKDAELAKTSAEALLNQGKEEHKKAVETVEAQQGIVNGLTEELTDADSIVKDIENAIVVKTETYNNAVAELNKLHKLLNAVEDAKKKLSSEEGIYNSLTQEIEKLKEEIKNLEKIIEVLPTSIQDLTVKAEGINAIKDIFEKVQKGEDVEVKVEGTEEEKAMLQLIVTYQEKKAIADKELEVLEGLEKVENENKEKYEALLAEYTKQEAELKVLEKKLDDLLKADKPSDKNNSDKGESTDKENGIDKDLDVYNDKKYEGIVKTGDESDIAVYTMLMLGSCAVAMKVLNKKRKENVE